MGQRRRQQIIEDKPFDVNGTEPYYPSFREFFVFRGLSLNQPRVIKDFHEKIIHTLSLMMTDGLPDGKRNLMLLMPPRHGKTMIMRDFISYGLGIFPDAQYIYTSYSDTLAVEQSRAIRDALNDPNYKHIFGGTKIKKAAADHFTTTAGGSVFATGLTSTITGFGAGQKREEWGGCIIIDDPLKAQDSNSAAANDEVKRWYTGSLLSRKNHGNTPIILIQQRLGPDDLPGHLLAIEPENWHVLEIPALKEDGTALWEDTMSARSLLKLRDVDPFTFWSQYMQKPQVEGGNIIKREWWQYYDPYNYDVRGYVFITADTAMKKGSANDPSSIGVWNATGEYLDLLEEVTGKWEFPELVRVVDDLCKKYYKFGLRAVFVEDKSSGTPLVQFLQERGIPVVAWLPYQYDFPNDKLGRVRMSTWYIEAGRCVYLPTILRM